MKLRILFFLIIIQNICSGQIFTNINGHADFLSEAPLEIISASSDQLQGVINLDKSTFAFKMYIRTFDGFNSELQKFHFYENYMEADEFPIATFKGKILEEISKDRNKYRAKGKLMIHGITVERIIEVDLDIRNKSVIYQSTFEVPLVEHDIDLPRIVYQKIADIILVRVSGEMKLKE